MLAENDKLDTEPEHEAKADAVVKIIERKRSARESALLRLETASTFLYALLLALFVLSTLLSGAEWQIRMAVIYGLILATSGILISCHAWALRDSIMKTEEILFRDVSHSRVTESKLWRDRLIEIEQMNKRESPESILTIIKLLEPVLWLIILGILCSLLRLPA